MPENRTFSLTLERIQNFEFRTIFDQDQIEPIIIDEPEPLGSGRGPNASRLLGAAVGNCLSASLLFCFQKARVEVTSMKTKVMGSYRRTEKGRLRVGKLDVHITIDTKTDQPQRVKRCLDIFENYCVVSASVRKGIEVCVTITDPQGNLLLHKS